MNRITSKYAYPFNLIRDIMDYDSEQIEQYMHMPPEDLEATLQYVFNQFLTEKERKIINLYYAEGMTLEEVGHNYLNQKQKPTSKEHIRQTIAKAMRKFKLNALELVEHGIKAKFEKDDEKIKTERNDAEKLLLDVKEKLNDKVVKIEALGLKIETYNHLKRAGIQYVSQMPDDIEELEGLFVPAIAPEVKEIIRKLINFAIK